MSDEEIINSIKMGYDAGIKELYQLNIRNIIKHIKNNNGEKEDAEEVLQDILCDFREKVIQNRFVLIPSAKIKNYLFEACKRKWLNELRKRKKITPETLEDYWHTEEEKRELNKRQNLVYEEIQKMGDKCRRILQLFCDRVPMEEIAKRLGFKGGEQVAKNEKAKCQKKLVEIINYRTK
jgi:RNA polymerase sigma factor (sigma-70 family)